MRLCLSHTEQCKVILYKFKHISLNLIKALIRIGIFPDKIKLYATYLFKIVSNLCWRIKVEIYITFSPYYNGVDISYHKHYFLCKRNYESFNYYTTVKAK